MGRRAELYQRDFRVVDVNYVSLSEPEVQRQAGLKAAVRYQMPPQPCDVWPPEEDLQASFRTPQWAITPGQAAVFYCGELVALGGMIAPVQAAQGQTT